MSPPTFSLRTRSGASPSPVSALVSPCLIGLGANLGNRARIVHEALHRLPSTPHVELTTRSRNYETAPVGGPSGQSAYLNAAATIKTSLDPDELLARLHEIEA